jgi:hypothetical protein
MIFAHRLSAPYAPPVCGAANPTFGGTAFPRSAFHGRGRVLAHVTV